MSNNAQRAIDSIERYLKATLSTREEMLALGDGASSVLGNAHKSFHETGKNTCLYFVRDIKVAFDDMYAYLCVEYTDMSLTIVAMERDPEGEGSIDVSTLIMSDRAKGIGKEIDAYTSCLGRLFGKDKTDRFNTPRD